MNKLIAALQAIEADTTITRPESGYLTDGTYEELHPLVQTVVNLAMEQLFTREGDSNWSAHQLLKSAGFPVSRGEYYDSFGWLSGIIHTKKGMIVYG
jgi:hypothetical protein